MKKYLALLLLLAPLGVSASFDRDLYYGLSGDPQVQELQEFLTEQGVYTGPITGNFFSLTQKAVKSFQTRELISPISGYFGPLSRVKANALLTAVTDESGTPISPVITPPKTTDDVVTKLLEQIALLQQQLTALQNQQAKLDAQQQTLGAIQQEQVKQTAALEQVKVNTTPAPAPVPVPPPAPSPVIKELRFLDQSIFCNPHYDTSNNNKMTGSRCSFSVEYRENFEPKPASITVSVDDPNGEISPITGITALGGLRANFTYYPSGQVGVEPYPVATGFRIQRTITATANGVTTTKLMTSVYYPSPTSQ